MLATRTYYLHITGWGGQQLAPNVGPNEERSEAREDHEEKP